MAEYRLKYEFSHLEQTTSPGFDGTWYDFTSEISDPDNVVFTFGEDNNTSETINQISSQGFERSVTGTLEATGTLYSYIAAWLIDHEDAAINMLQVRVTDVTPGCENFSLGTWTVTPDNLDWCDADECRLLFELREYRPLSACLQETLIWDNHQGWFPAEGEPIPPHIHPRFRYCDDIKPIALQNFLFIITQGILSGLFMLVNGILVIASFLQDLINAVFGSGTVDFADDFQQNIEDQASTIMQNMLGCGRMHPAPLVRNYFINACAKCGLEFESNIFNDPSGPHSRYYDTCLLSAPVRRGYNIDAGDEATDLRDWISDNRPNETALTLAASLKDLFNAKYLVENGVFKFNTIDTFPPTIVYDFTDPTDRGLVIDGICYSWNTDKKYASTSVTYSNDSQDQAGNEALHRYNGAKDWATNNPRYEGVKEIIATKYGVARFSNDGIDQKRIFSVTDGAMFEFLQEHLADTLLLQHDATALYKLLIWDAENSNPYDATVVKVPTGDYNIADWPNDWITQNSSPTPYYVFNNPLFFFPGGTFMGLNENLYNLHEIDDPTKSTIQNKSWRLTLELCCSNLSRLIADDTEGDGVFAHLDYIVQLPPTGAGVEQKGNIKTVILDYKSNEIQLLGDIKFAGA